MEEFRNIQENSGESLTETIEKVNAFLDQVLEERFDLKARKRYISTNTLELAEKRQRIRDKAENLGKTEIDKEMAKDILDAESEYEDTKKLISETKPEKGLSLDFVYEIKKYDKDGKLEKELSRVYGFKEGVENWRIFILLLNIALPDNPFFWDELKENSKSIK